MKHSNKEIKRNDNATRIFDDRSVASDYRTLVPILRPGLRVLDIGCGTGAISAGIAGYVGANGYVVGIDRTEKFIQRGRHSYGAVPNLELVHVDLFDYEPAEMFDLIVSARTLQWLSNPKEALEKMKDLLLPNGQVSILDYNHTALEWRPDPPTSMRKLYQAFLQWRADAGMNNKISEDLVGYFSALGFHSIEVLDADEVYVRGQDNFISKLRIWSKVAELTQIVDEGYLEEEHRLTAIQEYNQWVDTVAALMIMKLKEVRASI
ncbi:MAG: methyltransferase domain-containing protein [Cyclobacteriaceae bacterium]